MTISARRLLVAGLCSLAAPLILAAQGPGRCGEPELRSRPRNFLIVDANTAAQLEGRPRFRYGERAMVIIRNKNPYRYAYRTGHSTTPLPATLQTELISPLLVDISTYRGTGSAHPSRSLEGCSESDRKFLTAAIGRVDNATREIDRDLDALRKRITDAATAHDAFLKTISGEKIYCDRAMHDAKRIVPILDELSNPVTMIAELERLGDRINLLARLYDALIDSARSRADLCSGDVVRLQGSETSRIRANAGAILSAIRTIVSRRQSFIDLASIVASVNESSFTDVIDPFVPAGATSVSVEIYRRDMMVRNSTEVKIGEVLIDIDRPTPVTVSAGLGLSTVRELRVGVAQGLASGNGDTLASVFGYERNVVGMPSIVAMVNVHIVRWTAGESFDLSFGVSAGTVLESDLFEGYPGYVLGSTLGMLDDRLLLTTGVHWRSQEALAGGFSIGDRVPDGLTKIPLERNHSAGFMFALSVRLP